MPVLDLSKSKQTEIHLIPLRQETIQKVLRKLLGKKRGSTLAKMNPNFSSTKPSLLFSLHYSALPQNR